MAILRNLPTHTLPKHVQRQIHAAIFGASWGAPITSWSGTLHEHGLTYIKRGDTQCVRRANPRPKDPKTPEPDFGYS